MSTVAYITRDLSGTKQHGEFAEGAPLVDATSAKDISLNLRTQDVQSYQRVGNDLQIVTVDGQTLVLDNYFAQGITGQKNLFLSEDGEFIEVLLEDRAEGMLFPTYETLDLSGKWSAYDDLTFLGLDRIEPVVAPLVAPLLGGLGGLGTAAAAAGVIGAGALAAGSGGGDGSSSDSGDGGNTTVPTVDDPDAIVNVSGNTTEAVEITGTGAPGSEVLVNIGGVEQTTVIDDDGIWGVSFQPSDLPADGSYEVTVTVDDPDGVNHELDGPSVNIDTTPPPVEVTAGTESVGEIINASEHESGTVIAGTGEAGATVSVLINGTTRETTVAEDGTWSVTFTSSEIETGTYETAVSISSSDSFGNTTTISETLVVDTDAPVTEFNAVEGDDFANAAEVSDGVTISGTGEAGATLSVELLGETVSTTVGADGTWSAAFGAALFTAGEYEATATVTATDSNGNSSTTTHTFEVDTVAPVATVGTVETDDVINAAEAADGVTLSGTGEAGATVTVVALGTTQTALVADDGTWSIDYAASLIPAGETDVTATVSIVDAAGNVGDSVTHDVRVDRLVNELTVEDNQTADDIINEAEREAEVTLTGTVEAGSSVVVTFDSLPGQQFNATVNASGAWSVAVPANTFPEGTYTSVATITATDAAGNTDSITESFAVDTEGAPSFESSLRVNGSVQDLIFAEELSGLSVSTLADNGNLTAVDGSFGSSTSTDAITGETSTTTTFRVDNLGDISDGSVLVVTGTDDANNTASSVVVLEDAVSGRDLLTNTGLDAFDIESLNLDESDNANLTITEADIRALSGDTDTLVVQGSNDDTVTVTGATLTEQRDINGETFNVYTVGTDGATLIVEENVNVVI
ncbi:Ig-like domain-containing protein [Epibacterium ulvae]|uniref:Ig-like domain-containing protein n=1 Tax=Epibacterium ulvae TaxID=1156985 RepID=UPI002493C351|nr:Ig-like domain-containing protein [Epibacterium ulvae]